MGIITHFSTLVQQREGRTAFFKVLFKEGGEATLADPLSVAVEAVSAT
jgi:hypothetical protein